MYNEKGLSDGWLMENEVKKEEQDIQRNDQCEK